jgi:hypothetical protein
MQFFKGFFPLPPLVDPGVLGHRTPQRLAGAGAAETQTHRALSEGKVHLLLVGAVGVRIRFSGNGALGAGAVDATRDVVYGPWSQIPFVPEEDDTNSRGSTYVYAEAADGAANYECFVVQYQS